MPASDPSIWMGSSIKKSKWKRETDGGIFRGDSPAWIPDLSFNRFDDGGSGSRRIQ
jgi:hypothetical protein